MLGAWSMAAGTRLRKPFMPITFNCPCGKVLSAPDRDAGKPGVCPQCGRRTIVPLAEASLQRPDIDPARKAVNAIEGWIFSHQRTIWIFSAVASVLIVGGVVGYFALVRPRMSGSAAPSRQRHKPKAAQILRADADPSKWDTSFDSFAVAIRQSIASKDNLESIYLHQPVRWPVTFRSVHEGVELFWQEAEPLLNDNRAVRIWATLLPNERDKVESLRRGAKITITGKISYISSGRSAINPFDETSITISECEVILPEEETNADGNLSAGP